MSFYEYLIGPECGVDVYEESDENRWATCAGRMSMYSAVFAVPLFIILILVCIWYLTGINRVLATMFFLFLLGSTLLSYMFSEKMARSAFQRAQKELSARTSAGMSRAEALKSIQDERLQRELINAKTTSQNQRVAAFGIDRILSAQKK